MLFPYLPSDQNCLPLFATPVNIPDRSLFIR
uniref:Uncharacterized protein n=1 Tax=Arundo donax TaxID=35708 RepID=A0A0A8YRK4_ARUDO